MQKMTLWSASLMLLFLFGCTPKATQPVQEPSEPEDKPGFVEKEEESLSNCPKFSDAPSPDQAETNYVLYRDSKSVI